MVFEGILLIVFTLVTGVYMWYAAWKIITDREGMSVYPGTGLGLSLTLFISGAILFFFAYEMFQDFSQVPRNFF